MLPPTTDNTGGYVKQNLQKGSATVIAVVLVLLIGVAAAGWFVWSKNSDRQKTKHNATQQTQKTTDPSEGGKYLVIKEWGLRFPLPEEFRGKVKYGIFNFNDGSEATYFTTKEIAAKSLDGGCDLREMSDSAGQGLFGGTFAVSRADTKDSASGEGDFQGPDGKWYAIESSNGGECYPGDTGEERGRFNGTVEEAARHLELVMTN